MDIISKGTMFVKKHQSDILLAVLVFMLSFLSFGIGYLVAKEQVKEPLYIEQM